MKPVLLEWGKKPGNMRKSTDAKQPKLVALDPETREEVSYGKHGTPLSRGDFEGTQEESSRYSRSQKITVEIDQVVADNNFLVEVSGRWGISLGSDYDRFFDLGLLLAQQLDGKFREITRAKYTTVYQALEAALVKDVLAARKQRRTAGLESLLEAADGMPAHDRTRLRIYGIVLKQRPVRDYTEGNSDGTVSTVETRLDRIREDQARDDGFIQNCKLVPAELRADYVRTVEVAELHGNLPYSLHKEAEDIRKWVTDCLDVENGRLYLKVLNGLMTHFGEKYEEAQEKIKAAKRQWETARPGEEKIQASKNLRLVEQTAMASHPWEFYESLNKSLGRLTFKQLEGVHLTTISAAQDAGLWFEPYIAFDLIERVEEKEGSQAVKGVLKSAVEALKKGHDAFFDAVEKHGVPDYVRQSYVTAQPSKAAKA